MLTLDKRKTRLRKSLPNLNAQAIEYLAAFFAALEQADPASYAKFKHDFDKMLASGSAGGTISLPLTGPAVSSLNGAKDAAGNSLVRIEGNLVGEGISVGQVANQILNVTFNFGNAGAAVSQATIRPKPRVYVGHSAAGNAEQQILSRIWEAFEPLRMQPVGEQERTSHEIDSRIFADIGYAHGAVLVISRASLDSSILREEAGVLVWRRLLDPNFILLTILVDPITSEELSQKRFPELASLGTCPLQSADPDEISDKIQECFKVLRDRSNLTPFDSLEKTLVNRLEGMDAVTIRSIDQTLDRPGLQDNEAKALLAQSLMRHDISASQDIIEQIIRERIRNPVAGNRQAQVDTMKSLIYNLVPMWIRPPMARWLALAAFDADKDRRAVLYKGPWDAQLVTHLMTRALEFCAPNRVTPVQANTTHAGEDDAGFFVTEITASLATQLGDDAAEVDAALQYLEKSRMPCIVSIYSLPPPPDRQKLPESFRMITFLMVPGTDTLGQQSLPYIADTGLDPDQAEKAKSLCAYLDTTIKLANMSPQ